MVPMMNVKRTLFFGGRNVCRLLHIYDNSYTFNSDQENHTVSVNV